MTRHIQHLNEVKDAIRKREEMERDPLYQVRVLRMRIHDMRTRLDDFLIFQKVAPKGPTVTITERKR